MRDVSRYTAAVEQVLAALTLGLLASLATAAPTPAPVRAEIVALLARLQSSGCRFDRNGSWYSASEARDHMLRKLEYIEGRTTVQSTEQFIELAASRSSSSGRPYHVKCGTEAAVDSRQWLSTQLAVIRTGAMRKPPTPSVEGR